MEELLSESQVKHIAYLARLELSEQEVKLYQKELTFILKHVDVIEGLDIENIEPSYSPIMLKNVLREDERRNDQYGEIILKSAPETKQGFFVVPPILDEG